MQAIHDIIIQSTLQKKEVIAGEWNSNIILGSAKDFIEFKEMIPGGWNRQGPASNNQ